MAERSTGKRILFILVEVVVCLMIAIVLVGLVQQFFLAPVGVSGESMWPTINAQGDKVFVQKRFFNVEYRDVVVFYRLRDGITEPKAKNPANSITAADFFNSLPFVNKIPLLSEDQDVSEEYICVIKRVVGLPGDTIEIKYLTPTTAMLYRNGQPVNDFAMTPKKVTYGVDEGVWTVGEDELFVLGDNRNNSTDSEDYGPIKASWLMGKVVLARIGGKYVGKL